jgi:hypothetical protein
MATTTMTPTVYYGFNSFRSIYKTTNGVVSFLASEDIAGNTPVPMSPLNNNTGGMGGVTINPGIIDLLDTPGALTFKQSISNNTVTPLTLTATCKYKITVVN